MPVLWTPCPRHPGPEVHTEEVYNSNVGGMFDEDACHECNADDNARIVINIDSGCSAHMFSDWRVFQNFRTKTGIQVKCANGHLIKTY